MVTNKMRELVDLPYELILIIFKYVPSRDLWRGVRPTCRFLASIVADGNYWKRKLRSDFEIELPENQLHGPVSFLSYCCAKVEEEMERWRDGKLKRLIKATGHDGTVDAIMLMKSSADKRFCVSGARDRSLVMWDVNKIGREVDRENWKLCEVSEAHQGWIWNICRANTDTFYSCAWDRFVKQWRIVDGHMDVWKSCLVLRLVRDNLRDDNFCQMFAPKSQLCDVQLTSAVLCVINDGNTVICSTFGRKVSVLDARNSLQKITDMLYHRSAVFDLAQLPGDNYLYSCGEDRKIVCVDKRRWEVVNGMELDAYAQTMSLRQGHLLCGTTDGKLLSIDPNNLTIFNEVSLGRIDGALRQVRLNAGSLMCIARNRLLKVFMPGLHPKLYAESAKFDAEPSRFDYHDDDLVLACGDGSIFFCTS